ncbi:protein crumbs homolog 1 [Pelodytes ibericus]
MGTPFCSPKEPQMSPSGNPEKPTKAVEGSFSVGNCHFPPCEEDLPCIPEVSCGDTIDPCISNPCPLNATCQISPVTHTKVCRCPKGYTGVFCEIPMERCSVNICRHDGECYIGDGGPTCFCTMEFKGTLCETPEEECLWNPCQNGAVCRDRGKGHLCYCVPGFQGTLCDIEVDECISEPCQHGATCLNQIGKYSCVCPPEYTGRDCEQEFNKCSLGPCLNGGTCHTTLDSFSCTCPSGFYGDLCEMNVDECASSPCLNGGHCLDKTNGYTCNCSMVGFIGLHCQVPVSLCQSQPCKNNATCVEDSGMYTCLCQPGVHCEDIKACASNPCQNGGSCENTHGSYICHCPPHSNITEPYYGGRDCGELLIGCEGHTCQNGGSCIPHLLNGKHSYKCLCPAGFTEPDCGTQTTFSFNGKAVLSVGKTILQLHKGPLSNISLSFRTAQTSALIFHLGNSSTYLRLYVQDGYVFLVSYGNSQEAAFLHLSHNISDDRWHAMEIIFTDNLILTLLDDICALRCSNSSTNNKTKGLTDYTLQNLLFGGDNDFHNIVPMQPWFIGCMKDVKVDSMFVTAEGSMLDNIEVGCKRRDHCEGYPCQNRGHCVNLWLSYRCECYRPYRGDNCSSEYEVGRFGQGDLMSYAIFPVDINPSDDITISAFVKTRRPSGILLALGNSTSYDIVVSLEDGKLLVTAAKDLILRGESIINDGRFHLIAVEVTRSMVELFVSSQSVDQLPVDTMKLQASSVLYVGGLQNPSQTSERGGYFKGCVQDLRIGGHHIQFSPSSEFYLSNQVLSNVTQGCTSDDLCESSPCQNKGICRSVWDDFTCTCPLNTTGKACEDLNWCQITECPPGTVCRPVHGGYECAASAVFRGTSHRVTYKSNGKIVRHLTNLTLGFRTGCSESVLLHAEREPESITFALQDSRPVFHLRSGNGLSAVTLSGKLTVSDNQWHNVTLSMTEPEFQSSTWQMEIDGKTGTITSSLATGNLNFLKEDTDIYLGVHRDDLMRNFTGCLGTVVIGGIHLPYIDDADYPIAKPQVEQFVKISQGSITIGCLPYNPCASHLCMHGGSCQDFFTYPVCTCPRGSSGTFCELDNNECLSNPCLHGTCTNGAAGYMCECQAGYTGANCDINICKGHLCPNGATCIEGPDGNACICPVNVTGQFCSLFSSSEASALSFIRIYNRLPSTICGNEKKNITCYNHGNCTEERGELRCTCLPGFVGERCEVDINECHSDPCLNGGLCQNLPNRFLCICDMNFAGEHCETDQTDSLPPGIFTAVASVLLALFFVVFAGLCIFIAVAGMRSNQGTYSPSRQEKEGSRVEMWNIVQPPPLERLI